MADGELYTIFVNSSPTLSLPTLATDELAIVRSGVTYKIDAITLSASGAGITQLTGDVAAGPGVGIQAATLATVNSNVGTFSLATLTVNAKGLITAAANGVIPPTGGIGSIVYVAPLTGATLTAVAGQGGYVVIPAGAIAVLHLVLPPSADDGEIFEVSTTEDITAFDAVAAAGDAMEGSSGGPFTLAANGGVSWRYRLAFNTWNPRY